MLQTLFARKKYEEECQMDNLMIALFILGNKQLKFLHKIKTFA